MLGYLNTNIYYIENEEEILDTINFNLYCYNSFNIDTQI